MSVRLLAISGSLRRDSHNARLLRHLAVRAPLGVEVEIWDGLRSIPPYDADDDVEPAPAPVAELRQAIAAADALLIATPEYNASIPGVLKNAIDWASRPRASTPLQNKPTAVVGASTGSFGAVWAQAELRKVLSSTGARVIDLDLPLAKADQAFDDYGAPISADHDQRGIEILRAIVAEVHADRSPDVEPAAATAVAAA